MTPDPDESAQWVTGDYADPAARLIWLKRQRRVADGWTQRLDGRPVLGRSADPEPAATMEAEDLRAWVERGEYAMRLIDAEINNVEFDIRHT